MPLYTFTNEKGEEREELVSSSTRFIEEDGETWRRQEVSMVMPVGFRTDPSTMESQVKRGYAETERRQGARWKSGYSKKQIKKIWGF